MTRNPQPTNHPYLTPLSPRSNPVNNLGQRATDNTNNTSPATAYQLIVALTPNCSINHPPTTSPNGNP